MYTWDDVGNADRFVAEYADRVRFVPPFKKWLAWKGTHWEVSMGEHYELASAMIREMHNEAADLLVQGKTSEYKDLSRHIIRSAGRLDTFLKIASGHEAIRTNPEWLDSDRNYLNVRNLTLDLADGSIRAHTPGDMITKVSNAPYFPNMPRPQWEAFLAQVMPDPAVREYLKRLAGYTMLGDTQERLAVFLHGIGRNGKSVFVETIRHVLGDYAVGTPVETFISKAGASSTTNDLARLRGARMVVASEFEEGAKANIALMKRVTGDEKITARFLYGEYFDFPFEGTIWISTNHMPYMGAAQAVWDRIKIIEFPVRLREDEVDVNIKNKLAAEAPGILAWCVEGAQAYLAYGLEEPTSVLLAVNAERQEQDLLGPFVEEACDVDAQHVVTSGDLYRTYQWWATVGGEKPMTKRTFGLKLKEAGFEQVKVSNTRCWRGLRPKAEAMNHA